MSYRTAERATREEFYSIVAQILGSNCGVATTEDVYNYLKNAPEGEEYIGKVYGMLTHPDSPFEAVCGITVMRTAGKYNGMPGERRVAKKVNLWRRKL